MTISSDEEPECKVRKSESRAWNMMRQMGFKEGEGLGSRNQGQVDPVEANGLQNRQGIGMTETRSQEERPNTVWKSGMDEASCSGDIVVSLDGDRVVRYIIDPALDLVMGEPLTSIRDQIKYCNPKLLKEMVKCKAMLDQHQIFTDGRSRSNPYELIGAAFFMNRAAMKMANLDYLTGRILTNVGEDETLFFADICAGPGGFTEYILWRKPLQSCGFGFTLKGDLDFKLNGIICGPVECFHPSYGANDDGDITNEDNLRKFEQEVKSSTGGLGVHTVTADGGFSVEGKEEIQEILSKQLYLCQFICAINILRIGGNFVCKLFDTFTDFSVGLIHLMSRMFTEVFIVKPITSRPANSERYIILKGFVGLCDEVSGIRDYMYLINKHLSQRTDSSALDVLEIVSENVLRRDKRFCDFMRDVNDKILTQQIIALAKLEAFIVDRNLIDERQHDILEGVYSLWDIPHDNRDRFKSTVPSKALEKLINLNYRGRFESLNPPCKKNVSALSEEEFMRSKMVVRNHYVGFVGPHHQQYQGGDLKESTYMVVKDKRQVSWYPEVGARRPDKVPETLKRWPLSIPSYTMLLVHFNTEYSGTKGNIKYNSVVVVDAAMIYGDDITDLSYGDRMQRVARLCRLLDPKERGIIRPMEVVPLREVQGYLDQRLGYKVAKGLKEQPMLTVSRINHFFPPAKMLIINTIQSPWMVAHSKSGGYKYYYNVETHQSVVEKPQDLYTSFSQTNILEVPWSEENTTLDVSAFLKLLRYKLRKE